MDSKKKNDTLTIIERGSNNNENTLVEVKTSSLLLVNLRRLKREFDDPLLEDIYQKFRRALRLGIFDCYVATAALNAFAQLLETLLVGILWQQWDFALIAIMGSCFILDIVLFMLTKMYLDRHNRWGKISLPITVCVWIMLNLQIFLYMTLNRYPVSFASGIMWIAIATYLSFPLMPVCLLLIVALVVLTVVIHTIIGAVTTNAIFYPALQVTANVFILLCAGILGLFTYVTYEFHLRSGFLEAKLAIKASEIIQKESLVQEELLLSVLPKHVAEEMLNDLGKGSLQTSKDQFRKIYMYRHENVSILFADIVGFTSLSSIVTARELIRILNELFANFDKLAQEYHQLRIKILGDCYYCICGAPIPRSDHAVLVIHMGLSMVEEIVQVRLRTKSDVNMRVGVHTGAVLGGVMGQKQWQFDVLGKEVTLANKMESGGLPGRVHISARTANDLNGEFDLEPGFGETREDLIKKSGMKTYLVKSILKPFPQGTLDEVFKDWDSEKDSCNIEEEESRSNSEHSQKIQNSDDLYSSIRFSGQHLSALTLRFYQPEVEKIYQMHSDSHVALSFFSAASVVIFNFVAHSVTSEIIVISSITAVVNFLINITFGLFCFGFLSKNIKWKWALTASKFIDQKKVLISLMVYTSIILLGISECFGMLFCKGTPVYPRPSLLVNAQNFTHLLPSNPYCLQPWYFQYYLIPVTLIIIAFDHLMMPAKWGLLIGLYIMFVLISTLQMKPAFDRADAVVAVKLKTKWFLASFIENITSLTGVIISLIYVVRQIERLTRSVFFWRYQMDVKQAEVATMRKRNEQLLYNILPAHVARDFLGTRKRDEEIYFHEHVAVGVIFAACPNFNDFYTEDSINNNGLECLRFLNEIISDYDELLNEPRFQSISKIKTVGATYMAASGLNIVDDGNKNMTVEKRWKHLDDLVQFAFALKETLQVINDQSFNNFMLRIGINHGPVLAGVIGARKPHYDIWGNSVNVSSRMESTGESGKIQVVEETKVILEKFGYTFHKRGVVTVKGKGELTTYFLTGKVDERDQLKTNNIPGCVEPNSG